MQGNSIVIGLDYGTTYTGVSICETSNTGLLEKHIEVINDWPSRHTKIGTKEKVPSEIAYGPDGPQWGALIPPNVARHMWTKLELDRPQTGEAGRILQEQKVFADILGKQPVDIVADFLALIKDHLVSNLDHQYGRELWSTLPITLVVTVPAVWSDVAKDRTLKAVNMAGFNPTEFAQLKRTIVTTEPEAAAIYTIKTLRGSAQDAQLAVGDGFIVCDMGGGTVDLISYRVAQLQPTTVEEVTVGNGDQCGGTFVDKAFLQWLERRLGTNDFVNIAGCRSEDIPRTSLSTKAARMLQDFTLEVKSGFSGTEINFLRLPSPLSGVDDKDRGISDGEIRINPEDMVTMFDQPVRRTYELLFEQLQQIRNGGKTKIKYIFMVGGFAESPYVYSKIKMFAEANGLKAIRPAYAWSAVVRGAAAKGIEGPNKAVMLRKSRRHYGTACSVPFVHGLHLEAESFLCEYDHSKWASSQARWLIKKGQDLSVGDATHASIDMSNIFWAAGEPEMTMNLLACDFDVAPTRSVHTTVYTVAKLTASLSDVPKRFWKRYTSTDGRLYYKISTMVNISIESSLEFSITVNGQKYGTLTTTYE